MEKILNDLVDQYAQKIVETTQKLITIESVYSYGESSNQPFGKGPAKALEFMLSMAEQMGLMHKNLQGYVGYAELGEGEELVGVLSHLDVVPAGAGWDLPPFGGLIQDNRIYGRGAMDDKGPTVAALFALWFIKQSGLPITKRVRHIMGLNEEEGFGCIDYYLKNEEIPAMGFSPDGDFPVIHGEKGILQFSATDRYTNGKGVDLILKEISGGTAPNVVPGEAKATFFVSSEGRYQLERAYKKLTNKRGLTLEDQGVTMTVTAMGKSCHGSRPDMGENAIGKLLEFLLTVSGMDQNLKRMLKKFTTLFLDGYDGKGAGIACEDEISGALTMNMGEFRAKDGVAVCQMDVRYPITSDFAMLWHELDEHAAAKDLGLQINEHKPPLFVPLDHPLVQKLCSVYREMTGDETKPLVIGGGTYCRAVKNFVAFGPMFPHSVDTVHQANEHIYIPDLILMTKIYTQAIYELIK